jgi:hypothetical protein
LAKSIYSKRRIALLIKSGCIRFDIPAIKSSCVYLSANDLIMKSKVTHHVTDVN